MKIFFELSPIRYYCLLSAVIHNSHTVNLPKADNGRTLHYFIFNKYSMSTLTFQNSCCAAIVLKVAVNVYNFTIFFFFGMLR